MMPTSDSAIDAMSCVVTVMPWLLPKVHSMKRVSSGDVCEAEVWVERR